MNQKEQKAPLPTVEEIAEDIKGRRMVFTDQEWPDDTGSQFPKVYTYAYFLYARTPVRVHRLPKDNWCTAEKLNFRTGAFEEDVEALLKVEFDISADAYEVSKEQFYKKCDEFMAYWTAERIAEMEVIKEKNLAWLRERIALKERKGDGQ